MNILIENGIILPMAKSATEPPYYKGSIGIEGELIAFACPGNGQAAEFLEKHKDDCIRIMLQARW